MIKKTREYLLNPEGRKKMRWILLSVPVVAAIMLACIWAWEKFYPEWVELGSSHVVAEYSLPDGSVMVLAPETDIKYDLNKFKRGRRQVRIDGKALFHVVANDKHPFEIVSERGFVRANGADIQIDGSMLDATAVSVKSGNASFSAGKKTETINIAAGMSAILKKSDIIPVSAGSIDESLFDWASKNAVNR